MLTDRYGLASSFKLVEYGKPPTVGDGGSPWDISENPIDLHYQSGLGYRRQPKIKQMVGDTRLVAYFAVYFVSEFLNQSFDHQAILAASDLMR